MKNIHFFVMLAFIVLAKGHGQPDIDYYIDLPEPVCFKDIQEYCQYPFFKRNLPATLSCLVNLDNTTLNPKCARAASALPYFQCIDDIVLFCPLSFAEGPESLEDCMEEVEFEDLSPRCRDSIDGSYYDGDDYEFISDYSYYYNSEDSSEYSSESSGRYDYGSWDSSSYYPSFSYEYDESLLEGSSFGDWSDVSDETIDQDNFDNEASVEICPGGLESVSEGMSYLDPNQDKKVLCTDAALYCLWADCTQFGSEQDIQGWFLYNTDCCKERAENSMDICPGGEKWVMEDNWFFDTSSRSKKRCGDAALYCRSRDCSEFGTEEQIQEWFSTSTKCCFEPDEDMSVGEGKWDEDDWEEDEDEDDWEENECEDDFRFSASVMDAAALVGLERVATESGYVKTVAYDGWWGHHHHRFRNFHRMVLCFFGTLLTMIAVCCCCMRRSKMNRTARATLAPVSQSVNSNDKERVPSAPVNYVPVYV